MKVDSYDPIANCLEHIRSIEAYVPGEQPSTEGWIKLNTNEFPYDPPTSVFEAISEAAKQLQKYPNPTSSGLRKAIADFHGLDEHQVIVGNGSDDILNLLMRCFGGDSHVVGQTFPSYSLYPVLSSIANGDLKSIVFSKDFHLDISKIAEIQPDVFFLTNPNAPTGIRFSTESLLKVAKEINGILVIDEAYAEFAKESAISLLDSQSNIVITRTFSKAYGLAGLRVGYGLGSPQIIEILDKVRDSYNVNALSQAGAEAALREQSYYQEHIDRVKKTRDKFSDQLTARGWKVFPSETNFVFAMPESALCAATVFEELKRRKILVRYFGNHPLTENYLRISIGTDTQMHVVLNAIDKIAHENT